MPQEKYRSTAETWQYSRPAIWLHWLIGTLIFVLIPLGWYMMLNEHDPGSRWAFDLHKSLGLTAFLLIVLRIAWRAGHPPEGLPDSVPAWQAKAATLVHWGLYACMVIMPVTGYLGAVHQKVPPAFFGLPLPAWATPNHDVAESFFEVHETVAWVLVVLIVLHIAAGLKHLLIDRNRVFQRMWF